MPTINDQPRIAARKQTNYIKQNNIAAKQQKARSPNTKENKPPAHQKGVVPQYLKQRKQQLQAEKDAQKVEDPNAPPGMVLMPEAERLETLRTLESSKAEGNRQLSAMPLQLRTQKQKQRYEELEKKVKEIEGAIQLFSKPKVYIRD